MESSVLLSILVISALLVTVQGRGLKKCPSFKEKCKFRERDECAKDSQCLPTRKCCKFNCGKKCLGLIEDICSLPKVAGPCWAYFYRWWYDKESQRCFGFIYGGCKGNQNNFQSKDICQNACSPKLVELYAFSGTGRTLGLLECELRFSSPSV
ncbi:eppin [Sorex fumeus]|uniref:eppin n=1 Tax=Sorex fumeus TaxID=62283 RepID=UPI0024ADFE1D|nr:eppin [Sorex fumeus]